MRSTADHTPTASGRPTRFVFVGERRSRRAIQLGVRWEHGRLCARTLHAALRAIGIAPEEQRYVNLYSDIEPLTLDEVVLARLRMLAADGVAIVALGRLVDRALQRAGVEHHQLIHPAARGAIRARAAYQAHVASVLGRVQAATGCGAIPARPAEASKLSNRRGVRPTQTRRQCSRETC